MKSKIIVRMMAFAAVLMVGLVPASAQTPQRVLIEPESEPSAIDRDYLREVAADAGSVRVLVGLNVEQTGRMAFDMLSRETQQAVIAQTADSLLADLSVTRDVPNAQHYENLPMLALDVTPEQFEILDDSNLVTYIQENRWRQLSLGPGVDVNGNPTPGPVANIGMTGASGAWSKCSGDANTQCGDGAGQHIVILDSGVMKSHAFLAGKVVAEACYGTNTSYVVSGITQYTVNSLCPGGATSSVAVGSGEPCTVIAEQCTHGTHVAGIAAGKANGSITFDGVAKEAKLISIQVFSKITEAADTTACGTANECILAADGDIVAALDYIYTTLRHTYPIAAVNMSFGGGRYFTQAECDFDLPTYITPINNLLSAGIAVVASAGNNGYFDSMHAPACISGVTSVGATCDAAFDLPYDGNLDGNADCVTNSLMPATNAASYLTFVAPGTKITSSSSGGATNYISEKTGTSQSAAFISGAIAALRSYRPGSTQAQIRTALSDTAVFVDDVATFPLVEQYRKIQVNLAADVLISPDQPTLLSPASNAAFATSPIEFVWAAGDFTSHYVLQILNLSGAILTSATVSDVDCAADAVNFPGAGDVCKAQITYAFQDNVTYNWRVRARYDANSTRTDSELRPFQFDTPGRATLLSPADNSFIYAPEELTAFTWQEVTLATQYRVTLYDPINGAVRIKSPQLAEGTVCASNICTYNPTPTDLAALQDDKNYRWYVTSISADGTSKSEEWRIKARFPAPPLLISPANGFTFNSLNDIELTWTEISAATTYRLRVTDTSNGAVIVNERLNTGARAITCLSGTCTYVPSPEHLALFKSPRTYSWNVTTLNSLGSNISATLTFKTQFPAPPNLIAPATGLSFIDPAITFQWSAVEDADGYELIVVQKSTGVQLFKRKLTPGFNLMCDPTTCTYTLDGMDQGYLKNSNVHTWFVKSTNTAGKGKSASREFTLQSPPVAVLQVPANSSVLYAPSQATFSWSDVGSGANYKLNIVNRATGIVVLSIDVAGASCISSTCSYTLNASEQSKLKNDRAYKWRVVAINTVGKSKSANRVFFTEFPRTPNPIAPANNTTLNSPSQLTVLEWVSSNVSEPVNYKLRVRRNDTGNIIFNQTFVGGAGLTCDATKCTYVVESSLQNAIGNNKVYKWWVVATSPSGTSIGGKFKFNTSFN